MGKDKKNLGTQLGSFYKSIMSNHSTSQRLNNNDNKYTSRLNATPSFCSTSSNQHHLNNNFNNKSNNFNNKNNKSQPTPFNYSSQKLNISTKINITNNNPTKINPDLTSTNTAKQQPAANKNEVNNEAANDDDGLSDESECCMYCGPVSHLEACLKYGGFDFVSSKNKCLKTGVELSSKPSYRGASYENSLASWSSKRSKVRKKRSRSRSSSGSRSSKKSNISKFSKVSRKSSLNKNSSASIKGSTSRKGNASEKKIVSIKSKAGKKTKGANKDENEQKLKNAHAKMIKFLEDEHKYRQACRRFCCNTCCTNQCYGIGYRNCGCNGGCGNLSCCSDDFDTSSFCLKEDQGSETSFYKFNKKTKKYEAFFCKNGIITPRMKPVTVDSLKEKKKKIKKKSKSGKKKGPIRIRNSRPSMKGPLGQSRVSRHRPTIMPVTMEKVIEEKMVNGLKFFSNKNFHNRKGSEKKVSIKKTPSLASRLSSVTILGSNVNNRGSNYGYMDPKYRFLKKYYKRKYGCCGCGCDGCGTCCGGGCCEGCKGCVGCAGCDNCACGGVCDDGTCGKGACSKGGCCNSGCNNGVCCGGGCSGGGCCGGGCCGGFGCGGCGCAEYGCAGCGCGGCGCSGCGRNPCCRKLMRKMRKRKEFHRWMKQKYKNEVRNKGHERHGTDSYKTAKMGSFSSSSDCCCCCCGCCSSSSSMLGELFRLNEFKEVAPSKSQASSRGVRTTKHRTHTNHHGGGQISKLGRGSSGSVTSRSGLESSKSTKRASKKGHSGGPEKSKSTRKISKSVKTLGSSVHSKKKNKSTKKKNATQNSKYARSEIAAYMLLNAANQISLSNQMKRNNNNGDLFNTFNLTPTEKKTIEMFLMQRELPKPMNNKLVLKVQSEHSSNSIAKKKQMTIEKAEVTNLVKVNKEPLDDFKSINPGDPRCSLKFPTMDRDLMLSKFQEEKIMNANLGANGDDNDNDGGGNDNDDNGGDGRGNGGRDGIANVNGSGARVNGGGGGGKGTGGGKSTGGGKGTRGGKSTSRGKFNRGGGGGGNFNVVAVGDGGSGGGGGVNGGFNDVGGVKNVVGVNDVGGVKNVVGVNDVGGVKNVVGVNDVGGGVGFNVIGGVGNGCCFNGGACGRIGQRGGCWGGNVGDCNGVCLNRGLCGREGHGGYGFCDCYGPGCCEGFGLGCCGGFGGGLDGIGFGSDLARHIKLADSESDLLSLLQRRAMKKSYQRHLGSPVQDKAYQNDGISSYVQDKIDNLRNKLKYTSHEEICHRHEYLDDSFHQNSTDKMRYLIEKHFDERKFDELVKRNVYELLGKKALGHIVDDCEVEISENEEDEDESEDEEEDGEGQEGDEDEEDKREEEDNESEEEEDEDEEED